MYFDNWYSYIFIIMIYFHLIEIFNSLCFAYSEPQNELKGRFMFPNTVHLIRYSISIYILFYKNHFSFSPCFDNSSITYCFPKQSWANHIKLKKTKWKEGTNRGVKGFLKDKLMKKCSFIFSLYFYIWLTLNTHMKSHISFNMILEKTDSRKGCYYPNSSWKLWVNLYPR